MVDSSVYIRIQQCDLEMHTKQMKPPPPPSYRGIVGVGGYRSILILITHSYSIFLIHLPKLSPAQGEFHYFIKYGISLLCRLFDFISMIIIDFSGI